MALIIRFWPARCPNPRARVEIMPSSANCIHEQTAVAREVGVRFSGGLLNGASESTAGSDSWGPKLPESRAVRIIRYSPRWRGGTLGGACGLRDLVSLGGPSTCDVLLQPVKLPWLEEAFERHPGRASWGCWGWQGLRVVLQTQRRHYRLAAGIPAVQ